ncbi:hypothetical protein CPB83DRAFT_900021 [Crepidotus variabilis]|uniref:Uncharacterized protein n=1 Tax=Crepidotus variabilis TaxID=179855 RepID=A0A9P6JIB7_9AGAR|nr:hypothetical protein CPB83DRAFT_900021 [Crepidotus variabilis]
MSQPITDNPNAARHKPIQSNQRQQGQSRATPPGQKENLPPTASTIPNARPVREGAGRNMAKLIQQERLDSDDEDLSLKKRKRGRRETTAVSSTLTIGVPASTAENPMAPPKKKQRNKASGGQAGTALRPFDSSLMGAPVPTNVEPPRGQFNSVHSSTPNAQVLDNRGNLTPSTPGAVMTQSTAALPTMTTHVPSAHMHAVGHTYSSFQQSPPMPTPDILASQQSYPTNYQPTAVVSNGNQHQEQSTMLSFNFNNTTSTQGFAFGDEQQQQHFDDLFDGLAGQGQDFGMMSSDFSYQDRNLPADAGKTDLMLPSVNSGTNEEENSETENDEDEEQRKGDEGQAAEDDDDDVASQRNVRGNMPELCGSEFCP